MKPTFQQTVDVLVKAYLNDTLVHSHPCGCAVGNIIANKLGLSVVPDGAKIDLAYWCDGNLMYTRDGFDWFSVVQPGRINAGNYENGLKQIEITGYSIEQISFIEAAFESVTLNEHGCWLGNLCDPDGYNGLMAVVDILADIHGIDLTVKEEAKLLFVKLQS